MQVCNCTVRLGGSMLNTVPKKNVTVAEIVVLRAIHGGEDTVVNIQPIKNDKRPHAEELQRLIDRYGAKVVTNMFPGAHPKLPVDLVDIGVNRGGEAPKKPKAGKKVEQAGDDGALESASAGDNEGEGADE